MLHRVYFIDLDGVIVDSIYECFSVAVKAFNCFSDSPLDTDLQYLIKKQFFKFRGLVGPPHQYLVLLRTIGSFKANILQKEITRKHFEECFNCIERKISSDDKQAYTRQFFVERDRLLGNRDAWIQLNKLTEFGRFLKSISLDNHIVLTTKNREAARIILSMHRLAFKKLIAFEDLDGFKTKGEAIDFELKSRRLSSEAWFIDDYESHLDSVSNNLVIPWFADWGYGYNSGKFDSFDKNMWGQLAL